MSADFTQRFEEAKGWFRRAVWLSQQADPTSGGHANRLSNLANFLIREVQAGAVQEVSLQLEEARRHAEQALAIMRVLQSPEIWRTFFPLTTIAEMQGRHEVAHAYRRQERDSYASFAGNRYQIDQQFGKLFPALASAQDDLEVRAQMEELLSHLETNGWHISEALQRIWAGERDWQILAENLDNQDALFVLRVMETLAGGAGTTIHARSPEHLLSTLPSSIREALAKGDQQAFVQAFEALSAEEQQAVMEFLQALQAKQGEEEQS